MALLRSLHNRAMCLLCMRRVPACSPSGGRHGSAMTGLDLVPSLSVSYASFDRQTASDAAEHGHISRACCETGPLTF